jgi:hypothetical protein
MSAVRAGPQRAQIGVLDRRAIGHRIGEGHAQLDHIGAAFDQRVENGVGGVRRGIAPGDEADERGRPLAKAAERRVI